MSRVRRTDREHGFSFVELLVAVTITLVVTASVFAVLNPATGAFQAQPEQADVEQRLRVVTDVLQRDLLAAGGGVRDGALAGPLGRIAPAILPHRVGLRSPDPAGTYDDGKVTILTVEGLAAHSTLETPLAAASGSTQVSLGGSCPPDGSCGFRAGTTVVVFDGTGAWNLYSITAVDGAALSLRHNLRDASTVYVPGRTTIAAVTARTFMLRNDGTTGSPQLVQYDGASGADVPVANHVVSLAFEYYGEAEPPALVGGSVPEELRTSYGPPPPDIGERPTAYPSGENCVFSRSADGTVASRLGPLGAGPGLVRLSPEELTDGPWCPDEESPNRWDADLLRIRQVAVVARVQASIAALRGPAGSLFARGGTSAGPQLVPDREARFTVSPRALNMVR